MVSESSHVRCAPDGHPLLLVHGAGGGFDPALLFGPPLLRAGVQIVAPSRFGYLRTPPPADTTAQAQADAHACRGVQPDFVRARHRADVDA